MADRKIEFECPRCQMLIATTIDRMGLEVLCPHCQQSVRVPRVVGTPSVAIPDDDLFSVEDVFGVGCPVCGTRMQARPEQIGTQLECPDCFSKVDVEPPRKRKLPRTAPPPRSFVAPDSDWESEFRLEPLPDEPEIPSVPGADSGVDGDAGAEDEYGLAPIDEDLLRPRSSSVEMDAIPELEIVDPLTLQPFASGSSDQRVRGGSSSPELSSPDSSSPESSSPEPLRSLRPSPQEGAAEKRAGKDQGKTPKRRFKLKSEAEEDRPESDTSDWDADVERRIESIRLMLRSPGLAWRTVVAYGLLVFGWGMRHQMTNAYRGQEDPTMQDWLFSTLLWLVLGIIPYVAGTLVLWFICGYIFREAAQGRSQIKTWKVTDVSDLMGTFLLFAFSFFVAGLPVAFLWLLVTPFRFLVAPLLLLSAWYHQSPFAIVAVDAFRNIRSDAPKWKSFYLFIVALAALSVVGGLLLWVPIPILLWITSLAGMAMLVVLTLVFATVTGHHVRTITQGIKDV